MKLNFTRRQVVTVVLVLSLLVGSNLATWFARSTGYPSGNSVWMDPPPFGESNYLIAKYNSTHYCAKNSTGYGTAANLGYEFLSSNFSFVINSAITYGDTISLANGNFTLTACIMVDTGTTITGSGRSSVSSSPSGGTIITLEYDGNVFEASGSPSQGVTIRDLTINGQRHQRTEGTAIYGKFRNILVDNVFIMDMDTDGIAIEDAANTVDCWDAHIVNCHIWWIDEYGVRAGTRGTDLTIEGGHIAYCDIAGFYTTVGGHKLSSVTLDCSHYNVYIYGGSARLEGCNIDQAHRYNVYIRSISGDGSNAISISGGKISKASVETDNTYSQIFIEGYGTGDTNAARDIIIMGVQFLIGGAGTGQSKYCIEFAGINERDISVFGNDFRWGYQTAVMGGTLPTSSIFTSNEGYTQVMSEASYIISASGSYYYATSGTTGIVVFGPSTNLTDVEEDAIAALSGSGMVYLKDVTLQAGLTYGNNVIIVEEYNGQYKVYSNQGKGFLLAQLAADPSTSGWGASQAGYWWYNTAEGKIKFWDGSAIQVLPSVSGGTSYHLAYSYGIYKTDSTYYAEDDTGNVDYSGTNFTTVFNSAVDAAAGGGIKIHAGTYTVSGSMLCDQTGTNVEGMGYDTKLEAATGLTVDMIKITGTGTSLSNMYIDGTPATSGHCIYLDAATRTSMDHLRIEDPADDGIHLGDGTWTDSQMGGKIHHCTITTTASDSDNGIYVAYDTTDWEFFDILISGFDNAAGNAGIYMDGSSNMVSFCHFWGNYYNMNIAPLNHVYRLRLVCNGFNDNDYHGIYHDSAYNWRDSTITGNTFWANGYSSPYNHSDSIHIDGSGYVYCIAITGNAFYGYKEDVSTSCTRYFLNDVSDQMRNCTLVGNTFDRSMMADPVNWVTAGTQNEEAHNQQYATGS